MKLSRVRLREKFVMVDRGGVWEKIGPDKSRCIFGGNGIVGKEDIFNPESPVFVIFDAERPRTIYKNPKFKASEIQEPPANPSMNLNGTVRLVICDEDEKPLLDFADISAEEAVMMTRAEFFRFTKTGESKPSLLMVDDYAYDLDTKTFYLSVKDKGGVS